MALTQVVQQQLISSNHLLLLGHLILLLLLTSGIQHAFLLLLVLQPSAAGLNSLFCTRRRLEDRVITKSAQRFSLLLGLAQLLGNSSLAGLRTRQRTTQAVKTTDLLGLNGI